MKELSVIIVNYNVKYYLEQCLDSVRRAMEGINGEVFVVDNHSHDGSVEYLRERFPEVVFIESNHNLGFSRANNIAIRQSEGRYVLLLNPDTFVGEHVFKEALKFLDTHPKAGGVGGRMHNADGTLAPESRRALPTPLVSFKKMLGFSRQYYMSHLSWNEPAQIEVISGAFFMIRREAIDKIGLLDETFFMYGEDIDLSYRLLLGGYENWFLPLDILHYKGESTEKSSYRYVHVFYQAMLIFFRKHYGHLSWLVTLPIHLAIYFRAAMALVHIQCTNIRRFLGLKRPYEQQPSFSFHSTEENRVELRKLIRRKGLTEGAEKPCLHVFDTSAYTYADIIGKMESIGAPDSQLCTYNPASRILITPKDILK